MIYYLAHPVNPCSVETLDGNLDEAYRWWRALQAANPEHTIIAPWLMELMAKLFDAGDREQRAAALVRCVEVAGLCNGVILCGPRISNGMVTELAGAARWRWSESGGAYTVHRLRGAPRGVALVKPLTHASSLAALPELCPAWMSRLAFGECPVSFDYLRTEIVRAWRKLHAAP